MTRIVAIGLIGFLCSMGASCIASAVSPPATTQPFWVITWGNYLGQQPEYAPPKDLGPLIQFDSGSDFSAGVRPDGTVRVWGIAVVPGLFTPPANLKDVVMVSCGADYVLALTSNGTVRGWGNNTYGALNIPTNLGPVKKIVAGWQFNMVQRVDGKLVAWGSTSRPELKLIPTNITDAIDFDIGESHGLLVRSNGTVVAWGYNYSGECNVPAGLSNVVYVKVGYGSSFAVRADGTVVAWGDSGKPGIQPPPGLSNVVSLATTFYEIYAVKSDGSVVAWNNVSKMPTIPERVLAIRGDSYTMHALLLDPIERATRAPVHQDFDGDGRTDIAAFDPASATWYIRQSSDGATLGGAPFTWGPGGALPVPGDYDGDGKTDLALFEPATAKWHIRQSSNQQLLFNPPLSFGGVGMVPVPGDYDGDGKTDLAVFDSAGNWYVRASSSGKLLRGGAFRIGSVTGMPLPADYDGDGLTDPAVWKPLQFDGEFYSSAVNLTYRVPRKNDYGPIALTVVDTDGNGWNQIAAMLRRSIYLKVMNEFIVFPAGIWYNMEIYDGRPLGISGSSPVVGDYDGDGRTDPAYFDPLRRRWGIRTSSNNADVTLTWPSVRKRGLVPVDNMYRINKTFGAAK